MTRSILAVLAIVAAVGSAPAAAGPTDCDAKRKPADLNFTLKDVNGKDVALSSFAGKVIVLNFWATWCGPCKVEIPGFVDLYRKYRSQGLAIVGISVDDPVAKLKPYVSQMKMSYPVLVGEGRGDVEKAYPWIGLPNTFIIGRDGIVCRQRTGMATKEQVEALIKGLL